MEPLACQVVKMKPQPGDLLVVQVPVNSSQERIERVQAELRANLPDGVRGIVVTNNITLMLEREGEVITRTPPDKPKGTR